MSTINNSEDNHQKTSQPLAIMTKPDDSFPMFETNFPTSSQGNTISIITTPKKNPPRYKVSDAVGGNG